MPNVNDSMMISDHSIQDEQMPCRMRRKNLELNAADDRMLSTCHPTGATQSPASNFDDLEDFDMEWNCSVSAEARES